MTQRKFVPHQSINVNGQNGVILAHIEGRYYFVSLNTKPNKKNMCVTYEKIVDVSSIKDGFCKEGFEQ
tara:strand:+ start:44 stop:247 length:204 start_codon:yes stop_codon:yes gene_type:complete